MSEQQEELLLEVHKTILEPAPNPKQEPTEDERREWESPYKRCLRIMRENNDE